RSLKQLEGQIFYDIINQAANLPLFFNKSIFLKYACSVFTNLPSISNQYFEDNASIYVRRLPSKDLPDEQRRIVFFDLAQKFFFILEKITIPVLYTLWDVVIYNLNEKAPQSFFDKNALESYLSQNFTAIISDCFSIPDKEILGWGNGIVFNKRIDSKLLSDYFANSNDNTEDSVLPKYLSQYPKQTMQYLIHSYCNADTFCKKRAPFIFPQNSAQKENSLLSPLINSILEPKEQDNNKKIAGKKSKRLDQLELDHKYSLYRYLLES
ncbi:MAG: hypothetical protein LUE86_08720, partial [Clostridiales bacterium]|nr:hypothetical protein [Clostridiales bacterium]